MEASGGQFYLWILTVAMAVIGGILSLWGAAVQKKEAATGIPKDKAYRIVIASYICMSASMFVFALRGFLYST